MDTRDTAPEGSGITPALDLLRRVFIPIEKRNVRGVWTFKTTDGESYFRDPNTDVIKSATVKVNGKQARKARARARRTCQPSMRP